MANPHTFERYLAARRGQMVAPPDEDVAPPDAFSADDDQRQAQVDDYIRTGMGGQPAAEPHPFAQFAAARGLAPTAQSVVPMGELNRLGQPSAALADVVASAPSMRDMTAALAPTTAAAATPAAPIKPVEQLGESPLADQHEQLKQLDHLPTPRFGGTPIPEAPAQAPAAAMSSRAAAVPDDADVPAPEPIGDTAARALPDATRQPQAAAATRQLPGYEAPPELQEAKGNGYEMPLAMAMDLFLNRGRSLGQLMAQATAPKPDVAYTNYQRRQAAQHQAAENQHLMSAGQADPTVQAMRQMALEQGADRLRWQQEHGEASDKARAAAAEAKATATAEAANPDSATAKALRHGLYALGAPKGSLEGVPASSLEKLATTFAEPGKTQREIDKAIAVARGTVAPDVDKALQISHGKLPDEIAIAQARGDIQAEAAKQKAAAGSASYKMTPEDIAGIPGVHVRNAEALGRELQTRGMAQKINEDIAASKRIELATRETAKALRDYYAAAKSGNVHAFANAKARVHAYGIEVEGSLSALKGGQGDASDRARVMALIPDPSESISGALSGAVTAQDRVRGLRTMAQSNSDSKLAVHHMSIDFPDILSEGSGLEGDEPESSDNPQEEAAEPPQPAQTTRNRAIVPRPAHAAAPSAEPKTTVYRATKGGHTVEYALTPDQAAAARAKGWKLE